MKARPKKMTKCMFGKKMDHSWYWIEDTSEWVTTSSDTIYTTATITYPREIIGAWQENME